MSRYEIWLTTNTGMRIRLLNDILSFDGTRVTDGIAECEVALPPTFDVSQIKLDRMLQVWRAAEGKRLSLWRIYLIRRWEWRVGRVGRHLTVGGVGPRELLARRIVPFSEEDSEGQKTGAADDIMKEIVDENMVSSATAARNWSALSVQVDFSDGPTLTRTVAYENVYRALAELQRASATAGDEVWFDVVPSDLSGPAISFEFRTRINEPRVDRTSLGVRFSAERGNLIDAALAYDYRDEETYIYALGQGEGADRELQEQEDAARVNASSWNRREGFTSALGEETANGVREAARAELRAGEPRRQFRARALDTAVARYGVDWEVGDRVVAEHLGTQFEVIVAAVRLRLRAGRETIDARLEYAE